MRPHPLAVLAPFAAGFFLSYFFRSLNAVLSPRLEQDLGLGPEALGWLTSAYFLGFAAFQIPLGLLLDRFGPARVQAGLLLVAAAGTVTFAFGETLFWLMLGRSLIGIGLSGALMSAFMTITHLFEPGRRALANGSFLVFGGLGAVVATGPLDQILALLHWRSLFLVTAAAAALLGLVFFLRRGTSDRIRPPAAGRREGLRHQLRGLGSVMSDRDFWRIAPLSAISLATIWSFQGLWTALWLRDVSDFAPAEVVVTLSAMAVCTILGNFCGGLLSDRLGRLGIPTERVLIAGCLVLQLAELSLILHPDLAPITLWSLFAFLTGFGTLAYAVLPQRFPPSLTGRALTGINILSLFSAFLLQAAVGVVVEQWLPDAEGRYPVIAYRTALGLILLLQAAALLHCLLRRSREKRLDRPS